MKCILVLSLMFASALSARAAQPPAPTTTASDWQRVEALPAGAHVDVKARARHINCRIKSVDADTLTCSQATDVTFQRTDILSIKIPRRGRSTLIAMGIGGGVGAIVGAATSGCSTAEKNSFLGCFLTPTRPQGAAIGGLLFGVIGAPIGYFTDFSRSTVYKAP